jgi:hypothetical protein
MEGKKSLKEMRIEARESGLRIFNEGVPCAKGHLSGRYTSNNNCVDCHLAYLERNKDAYKENGRAYREKNRDRLAANQRDYYKDNKDACQAYQRAYYIENHDYVLERQRVYSEQNKDRIKAYFDANKEILRAKYARKRVSRANRRVNWGEDHSQETRETELRLYEMAVLLEEKTGVEYNVDHMIPLKGNLVCGLHVASNLQVIPEKLNREKRNKFVLTEEHEWMLALSNHSLMNEPSWYKDAEKFYRELGWSFQRGCYTTGPHSS